MSTEKKQKEKSRLHPRNKNRGRYNLEALISSNPALKNYVKPNKYGENTIDFSIPEAVKLLNKALLNHYYGITHWEFPDENLCPPIPGRADYIHHIAALLGDSNRGNIPRGNTITCLDIGVGASCIYPILGVTEYGWNFIGSEIDPKSVESARNIIKENASLKDKVEIRLQENSKNIFAGILSKGEKIDLSICNPPFHSSAEEAMKASRRKVQNLSRKKIEKPKLNFSGNSTELICEGGENKFINDMARESKNFSKNCYWFSTLVSKQSNLKGICRLLEELESRQVKTIPMGTGNKSSRIVAWTFLSTLEQKEWREARWKKEAKAK